MDELKPCPYCGGKAIIAYNAKRKNAYGKEVKGICIGCDTCPAMIFWSNVSVDFAIQAWNRRVGEQE